MYQYTLCCSIISLSLNQCHFISHVFELFGVMTEFTNPFVVELSFLKGVAGCLWSNAIKSGRMPIALFPLLKLPRVSASAAEDNKLWIVLHSVWIGLFILG